MSPSFAVVGWLVLATGLEPLSPEEARILRRSAEDELTKEVCQEGPRVTRTCRDELSYVISNEKDEDVFEPHIRALGGAYLGIGADQSYTFIAWARPQFAFLMDYDPTVSIVHRLHRAFLLAAETRADFRTFWKRPERGSVVAALRASGVRRSDVPEHLAVYKRYRRRIDRSFDFGGEHDTQEAPHWLASDDGFAYVRQMYVAGRVRILAGDLLEKRSVRGIARITRKLGVPVRLVYLSNAEEFWRYSGSFRRNLRALPMDEKSRIIRTRSSAEFSERLDGKFSYVVQAGLDYQSGLGDRTIRHVNDFLVNGHLGAHGELLVGMRSDTSGEFAEAEAGHALEEKEPRVAQ